jgi:hypothetical protein
MVTEVEFLVVGPVVGPAGGLHPASEVVTEVQEVEDVAVHLEVAGDVRPSEAELVWCPQQTAERLR